MGGSVGGAVENIIDDVKDEYDRFEDTVKQEVFTPVQEFFEPVVEPIEEAGRDIYQEVIEPIEEESRRFERRIEDIGKGLEYLTKESFDGNWKAALGLTVSIASIVLAGYSLYKAFSAAFDVAGLFSDFGGENLLSGFVSATIYATAVVGIVSLAIYSIYSVVMQFADLGEALRNMKNAPQIAERIQNQMRLDYTSSWINGSMGLWMAGGMLYDAPRAGDVQFKPDGNLNTLVFLGKQNLNTSKFGMYQHGHIGRYNDMRMPHLAGHEFFSVKPLAKAA